MRPVQIMTDSCSDLSAELLDKYGIDYFQMNTVYEGNETPASLRWEHYSPKELYDVMRAGNRVLTNQVPAVNFERGFKTYLDQGMDIVYIGCALPLSKSVETGELVAQQFRTQYPDAYIACIDAKNCSGGEALLALHAAQYRDEGLDARAIADKIRAERPFVQQWVTVDSLEFLKRAGRVKASKAFFGNLMGVRPLIISDAVGNNVPVDKARGRMPSLQKIVDRVKENVISPETQTVYVVHADCLEDAQKLAGMLVEQVHFKDYYISYIGPIVGSSIGPGAVGAFAMGKEVTTQA
ncbi:MAG: DegV family protein [Clostridia bacterium]|nr:DegV family protein [Clostridia bacterium]